MGSKDKVASPTFTISKVYEAKGLEVHHFDFYRLSEAGIVADELAEVAGDPAAVVVVEWGDVAQHVLPANRLSITFQQNPDGARTLTFTCPTALHYLMEAVKS
jgi:tRNA threonylcarbamoyladenosine biosynthesis protein TsaE